MSRFARHLAPLALVPLALTALLGFGGCGGSGPDRRAGTAAAPTWTEVPPPDDDLRPVRIRTPRGGAVVRGRRQSRAALVRVTLAGTAAPGQKVRVDGHCRSAPCRQTATTTIRGDWTTELRMSVPASARRATVTADYARGPADATRDRVRLAVRVLRKQVPPSPEASGGSDPLQATTPSTGSPDTTTITIPPPASGSAGRIIFIGDSLTDGMKGYLQGAFPGWGVSVNARIGRGLAEGMGVLGATRIPDGAVLAMGLFTNDDPWNTKALSRAIATSVRRAGPGGCVIWATIAAPPVGGQGYAAANSVLERAAGTYATMRLVDWAGQMAAHPGLLAADGVHPSDRGYLLRARLYAQAASSCD